MFTFIARFRRMFAACATLLGCVSVAQGANPSDNDVYSVRLGIRYRIVTIKTVPIMVVVSHTNDSPLRALPVDLNGYDIIMAMDGESLPSSAAVESHYAATSITLINNKTHDIRTCWVNLPPLTNDDLVPTPAPAPQRLLGVWGENCVLPIVGNGGPAGYRGLVITGIVANSPAHRAGLFNGLMIGKFNDERVIDMDSLREAVANSGPVATVLVYYPNGSYARINVALGN